MQPQPHYKNDLTVDFKSELRQPQPVEIDQFSAEDLLNVLCMFDPYGVWRLDVTTGLVYWSQDVFRIHEMEASSGPVDLGSAINRYHPEDRPFVTQLIEETVANRSAFRFVLRLKRSKGGYKLVKATGKYRHSPDGAAEIVGTFSEFQTSQRALGAVG